MKIKIYPTIEEASQATASIFADTLKTGQEVFGFATGSTPERTYQILSTSDLDFSNAIAINLDEYIGLSKDHPQSYAYFMNQHLFQFKPFKETYIPNGENLDVQSETQRYDKILQRHPRDLQILGIGSNGHIAFNEPGSPFNSKTRKVTLTPSTIKDNRRFFNEDETMPTEAYTMGIQSIIEAKHIVLLAFGKNKAEAIKAVVEGPVTEDIPASILQKHPNITLILHEDAAHLINKVKNS